MATVVKKSIIIIERSNNSEYGHEYTMLATSDEEATHFHSKDLLSLIIDGMVDMEEEDGTPIPWSSEELERDPFDFQEKYSRAPGMEDWDYVYYPRKINIPLTREEVTKALLNS